MTRRHRLAFESSLVLLLATTLVGAANAASEGERPLPGSYCPIPEPGEDAVCIDTARAEYGSFVSEVEAGRVRDESAAALEADLNSEDRAYLALSSLAYGYYRLAQHAAAQPSPSPVLTARLDRWNLLLSSLYADSDAALRSAVQEAANDLYERAPRVPTQCGDAAGELADCDSAGLLVWTLQHMEEQSQTRGVQGALSRLLDRFRGGGD